MLNNTVFCVIKLLNIRSMTNLERYQRPQHENEPTIKNHANCIEFISLNFFPFYLYLVNRIITSVMNQKCEKQIFPVFLLLPQYKNHILRFFLIFFGFFLAQLVPNPLARIYYVYFRDIKKTNKK